MAKFDNPSIGVARCLGSILPWKSALDRPLTLFALQLRHGSTTTMTQRTALHYERVLQIKFVAYTTPAMPVPYNCNQWRLLTDEQGVRASLYSWFSCFRAKMNAIIPFSRWFSLIFAHSRENQWKSARKRQSRTPWRGVRSRHLSSP